VLLALGSVAFLVYSNSFRVGLTMDSHRIILEDPRLRQVKLENLKLIFTQDYWWPKGEAGLYRPITTLSYLFNYSVLGNGRDPMGYHVINLLLHWANASLLYVLGMLLLNRRAAAFFMAALFAVHPIATEAVTYVVGRADLFATLSVLSGLLLYIKSTQVNGKRKLPWLLGLLFTALLGFFAKENSVGLLGVMALYDVAWQSERKQAGWADRLAPYVAVGLPLALMFCARSLVYAGLPPPQFPFVDNPLHGADFWTARLTAVKVIGKHLWLLLWPRTLSNDYSYNQIPLVHWPFQSWEDWKAAVALIAVVAALATALFHHRRNRPLFFFILFFFVTLLPTANLVILIGSVMAERFLYLPSVGFAGSVVIAVYSLPGPTWRRVLAPSLLGLLLIPYGARAFARNLDWQDGEESAVRSVAAAPNSFKTHLGLAFELSKADPTGANLDRVIQEAETALAIVEMLPVAQQHSFVFLPLADYYRQKGDRLARVADGRLARSDQGAEWYRKSIDALGRAAVVDRAFQNMMRQKELRRRKRLEEIGLFGSSKLYESLGLSYMRLQRFQDALDSFLEMRRFAPSSPEAYIRLAEAYEAAGRLDQAAIALLQLLVVEPTREVARIKVVDLYRRLDPQGCALDWIAGRWTINVNCPLVHRDLCTAYDGVEQVHRDAKRFEAARQIRAVLKQQSCEKQ